ncbi:uncharacterized protein LOC108091483 [Drosophila ficusphila]|uniref:uncharacterized protein LOC108091483 n=1 Tax=Drosophila ficusphila TaxID=30025 RepID=UPI0007E5E830|nr:uncharacterized protein LOC108091483 [Drosophila ficusphila]
MDYGTCNCNGRKIRRSWVQKADSMFKNRNQDASLLWPQNLRVPHHRPKTRSRKIQLCCLKRGDLHEIKWYLISKLLITKCISSEERNLPGS